MFVTSAFKQCAPVVVGRRWLSMSSSAVVQLVPGKSRLFKEGNPLVFGGAVDKVIGNAQTGYDVQLADHQGNVFGRGFFNDLSQYRVRITALQGDRAFNLPVDQLIAHHIDRAIERRRAVLLPSSETNAYRLVNGEGDGLSGLMIDVLGQQVVVQSSALWVEMHAERIAQALRRGLLGLQVVWKPAASRLQQDGLDKLDHRIDNPLAADTAEHGNGHDVLESGLVYQLSAAADQKTGFYCDQRDNRLMVRGLAKGKRILDAYCYTGGFSLNALTGGAQAVTAIDSSRSAIEAARGNAIRNNFLEQGEDSSERLSFVCGDAVQEMVRMKAAGSAFDMVILDPPKLAPTRNTLSKAISKYTKINAAGMSLLSQGGLLLTCSCSAAMTQSPGAFVDMLQRAAGQAGRQFTILSMGSAAKDHPVSPCYLEGRYLTAALLHVQ